MYNIDTLHLKQKSARINLSIILASLICFTLLWMQLFGMLDASFKTTIILPAGICLIFIVSCFGGWLYLRTVQPEKSLYLKIFLLITAVCSLLVPFLIQISPAIMVLTILVPLLYLLFIEVFPKNTKYLRLLKYFSVFVAGYGLVIGFGLSSYVLSQEFGNSQEILFIFSVASSLILLPIFGLVFIGTGLRSFQSGPK
ncbi:hypothetical protein McpSp1_17250 [Methanocorpusculaceae archaeon Sp1]|nr:hypothetical protein [Methanocorpusculaceae archaeon Sp1]